VVEAPAASAATEAAQLTVEGLDEIWLVFGLGEHGAALAGV
jgi:hypothetical protein